MELDEFVELTLGQILKGVTRAQEAEGGGNVSPLIEGTPQLGGNLISLDSYGMFTRVDFDVSVSAEKAGGGSAKLSVFGVGADASGSVKASAANRICFGVLLRIPEGDTERTEQIRAERAANAQRRKDARRTRKGEWL